MHRIWDFEAQSVGSLKREVHAAHVHLANLVVHPAHLSMNYRSNMARVHLERIHKGGPVTSKTPADVCTMRTGVDSLTHVLMPLPGSLRATHLEVPSSLLAR